MDWLNRPMLAAALSLLDVQLDSKVLEIGFGTGALVERLGALAPAGRIAGIDLSPLMVAQATRRNRQAVQAGRVELRCGSVSALPFADRSFDRVVAVNAFQFWPTPLHDLREVRRVLAPGGRLVLGMRLTEGAHPRSLRREQIDPIRTLLAQAGFARVAAVERRHGRGSAVYIIAV
jgi:ubiquinone/menaquinone biosynthesis C-methylase UbiE